MQLNDSIRFVPPEIATRAVFSIGSERFTVGHVIAASHARGSWQKLMAIVHAGVLAEALAKSSASLPTDGEVSAAMTKFRYDRNLIAGDDLVKWLDVRGISSSDWERSLRLALLRERFASQVRPQLQLKPPDDGAVAAAVWPEAVIGGFMEQAGWQLASDAALTIADSGTTTALGSHDFKFMQAAAYAARLEAKSGDAIEREVVGHRLEWTRLTGRKLELADEDVAKEAAMCVRDDGSALADVARDCGSVAEELDVLLEELDEALSTQALAAHEGDLIGPLRTGKMWVLLAVERKTQPNLDDPLVRRRAEEQVIRSLEERAIGRWVTWHEFV